MTRQDIPNHLLKDLPDLIPIVKAYEFLYKRKPNGITQEIRDIQKIWNESKESAKN